MEMFESVEEWAAQWPNLASLAGAVGTVLTTLIAVVAAIYAARQVRLARLEREDRNRPFVTVMLRPSHGIVANIVIRNEGTTVARNVRFAFTPEWESSDPARTAIRESKVWREGIPNLVPGQELAIFADMFPDRYGTTLPRTYDVEVSCDGRKRRWRRETERLTDSYVLDFDIFHGYRTATLWGLHDIGEALRRINTKLEHWQETAIGPLSVVVRDGDRRDERERAEMEEYVAERAAERAQAEQPRPEDDTVTVRDAATAVNAQHPIRRPPAARRSSGQRPANAADEGLERPKAE